MHPDPERYATQGPDPLKHVADSLDRLKTEQTERQADQGAAPHSLCSIRHSALGRDALVRLVVKR